MARAEAALPEAGWRDRGWTLVLDLALIPAVFGMNLVYDLLNHGPYRLFLRTPIDQALPVVPVFVIPYDSLTPFIVLSLLAMLAVRSPVYRSAAFAMLLAWAVSYAFYFFAQSYVDRPVLTGTDTLTRMIRDVYASDKPYNDFPSLHTSLSTIIAIHWWRIDRRVGVPVAAWTVLIVASTLLVKQHYVPDLALGLALAAAASWLTLRVAPTLRARWRPPEPRPGSASRSG